MLETLTQGAREDAEARLLVRPFVDVERAALAQRPALDARLALAPADTVKVIAEVKRASPSKGPLATIPDPADLARKYATGGATAISVLTEGRRFLGSLADLEQVRQAVQIPVLRKDFISLPYQVFEARASGADLVLLIVAALPPALLRELYDLTTQLGMTALVETHTSDELDVAIDLGASVIGVNARNLSTFELDINLFGTLAGKFPAGVTKIAESAVTSPADVAHYRAAGADVVLVGEALVTSGDPATAIDRFRTASHDPA